MSEVVNPGEPKPHLVIKDLFKLITELYYGPFESSINLTPHHDIFLCYDDHLKSNSDEIINSPEHGGISGSAIWAFDNSSNIENVWSAEKIIKIAGFPIIP